MSGGAAAAEPEGTATIPNEVFNLVKSIVGAGVLSVGSQSGLAWCVPSLTLLFMLLFVLYFPIATMGSRCVWEQSFGTGASSSVNCGHGSLIGIHLWIDWPRVPTDQNRLV